LQEDIENKTIALTIKATQLTAKGLAKAFMTVLRKIQKDQAEKAQRRYAAKQKQKQQEQEQEETETPTKKTA